MTLKSTQIAAAPVRSNLLSETWVLYKRSLTKLSRRPLVIYFSIIQPAIWLLLFSQMFNRIASLPGATETFGTSNYMAFFTPGVIMMTMLFGAGQTGIGLIQDMDSGFLDKLLATPINRFAIILGKMLGDLTRMILQALLILVIAMLAGVRFEAGLFGITLIVIIAGLFGMAIGGISTMVALRTRNTETTFLIANFVNLPLMFTSTAMMPLAFLPAWMQAVAVVNPVTYAIEGMRGLVTTGFDPTKIFSAILVLGVIATATVSGATLMFKRRVV